jgi:GntR family transcriptional regulator
LKKHPAYLKVYNSIKASIDSGEFKVSDLLPTEPSLEDKYDVSRITIRKAIELLSNDGYVRVKQGYGTTVLDPGAMQKLSFVTSLSETMASYGYKITTKNMHIDEIIPSKRISDKLNLTENTPVIRIQRLQLANDKPISIMTNYIISDLVPNIRDFEDQFISLYLFLESEYDINIDASHDLITANTADLVQAKLLQIPIGSPLLHLTRTSYSEGQIITVDDAYIDATRYKFSIHLAGRGR